MYITIILIKLINLFKVLSELVNTGQGYYFVVGSWLSNLCHGFSNSLGTFSTNKGESLENRGRKVRKNSGQVQRN